MRSELELLLELVRACLAAGSDLIRALRENDAFLCLPPGVRSSRTAVRYQIKATLTVKHYDPFCQK